MSERNPILNPVGELVDPETGEVVSVTFHYSEWKNLTKLGKPEEDPRRRASGVVTFSIHDYGLHTYIPPVDKWRRLSELNDRIRVEKSRERKLVSALTWLWRAARPFLGDAAARIVAEAGRILRKLFAAEGSRALSPPAVAASLLAAARIMGAPLLINDVVEVIKVASGKSVSEEEVWKWLRRITAIGVKVPSIDPRALVPRIRSALGLPEEVDAIAIKIVGVAMGLRSARPQGLAAAAVYIAAAVVGRPVREKDVARAIGTSDATVRTWIREILKRVNVDIVVEPAPP